MNDTFPSIPTTYTTPCSPCEVGNTNATIDAVTAVGALVTETKNEVSKLIPADIDWTPRFFKSSKNVETPPADLVFVGPLEETLLTLVDGPNSIGYMLNKLRIIGTNMTYAITPIPGGDPEIRRLSDEG